MGFLSAKEWRDAPARSRERKCTPKVYTKTGWPWTAGKVEVDIAFRELEIRKFCHREAAGSG